MKRFFYIMAICLICGTLLAPQIDASDTSARNGSEQRDRGSRRGTRPSRGNSDNRNNRHQGDGNKGDRPGNNGNKHNDDNGRRNGGNNGYRPDNGHNNGGRPDNGYRPDNGNNGGRPDNGYRPGNGNNGGRRPGDNGGHRPGNGYNDGNRYDNNHNHGNHGNHGGGGYRPDHGGYRPSPDYGGHHYGHINRPPHRPYRPVPCYHRPTPPVYYRPHCHISPLQAVLGVALGVAFDNSVNVFIGRNYYVDGYSDNYLYMRDVNAYNYNWPDVMLYYNNGYLASSQFSYSSPNYDGYRYNNIYSQLYNAYGAPAIAQNITNGRRVTWWGYDNQYVTLEFQSTYNYDGGVRYYTTLIIGQ